MSSFNKHVDAMPGLMKDLLSMDPVDTSQVPISAPKEGVYLFMEGNEPIYVGRSSNIRSRIAQHRRPSSGPNVAALAMLIARRETGMQASYKPSGSRNDLVKDPVFRTAFDLAKEQICEMNVKYVEITDPMRQAMFEMYLADALDTPYNHWKNH